MRTFSGQESRTEYGVYHYLAQGADRTGCGRVPAWNWYTTRNASGTECKRCLAKLARVANHAKA